MTRIWTAKKSRKPSPRTLVVLDLCGGELEHALTVTDEKQKERSYSILLTYDQFIQESAFLSWEPTPAAARLAEEVLTLRKFEYFGRYGDYWARMCKSLKNQAWEDGADGQDVYKLYWTEIQERIKAERQSSQGISKDTPTLVLIYNTCFNLNISPEHMLWAIERYAERNTVMHSSVTELLQRGDWAEFATLLHNDTTDLEWVIPPDMKDDLSHMRTTIETIRHTYFEIDPGDESSPRSWVPSTKAGELKAQFRKEVAEKLAAKEAEIARMKECIAKKEAKEAAEEQKFVKALRGVKRQSGSDLPDWAQKEHGAKRQKVEQLLGIQTGIEKLEATLDAKYQQREEMLDEVKKWALDSYDGSKDERAQALDVSSRVDGPGDCSYRRSFEQIQRSTLTLPACVGVNSTSPTRLLGRMRRHESR